MLTACMEKMLTRAREPALAWALGGGRARHCRACTAATAPCHLRGLCPSPCRIWEVLGSAVLLLAVPCRPGCLYSALASASVCVAKAIAAWANAICS